MNGKEEGYWWNITCRISDTGKIKEFGAIRYRNEKYDECITKYRKENKDSTKEYNIQYRKAHPKDWKKWPSYKNRKVKEITLGLFYEDGNSFILRQAISEEGKIYGIGSFRLLRSSAERSRQHRIQNSKNLVLLNDYFPDSELHHLSNVYGIYIPKSLHRSVYHNLKSGRNMNLVNEKALRYWDLNNNKSKKANYFK